MINFHLLEQKLFFALTSYLYNSESEYFYVLNIIMEQQKLVWQVMCVPI